MTHLKLILVILLGVIIVILAIQNNEAMSKTVQFRMNPVFFAEKRSGDVSLYQVVLVSFLLGVVATGVYGMVERFRMKRQIKTILRELQDKEKELSSLRNLPLTYEHESAGETQGT